jgi:hypothetical protein
MDGQIVLRLTVQKSVQSPLKSSRVSGKRAVSKITHNLRQHQLQKLPTHQNTSVCSLGQMQLVFEQWVLNSSMNHILTFCSPLALA